MKFCVIFISLLIITFWLLVFIVMCILCASTVKIQHIIHIKFMISFTHVWDFFRFAWAFKVLNSLREVWCLRFQACKETWLDFFELLTCLWFFEESVQWISFVSSLFSFFLLSLSWSIIFCKVMIIYLWNVTFSLLLLLLSCSLMTWFLMRSVCYLMFVAAC